MAPTDLEIVRASEGMLAILLAGTVAPQAAAWAIDAPPAVRGRLLPRVVDRAPAIRAG
jgi:hypothetical protein